VHRVHDVRQMDIHMAEPLMPQPNLVKMETAIGKLKWYKSLGTDQILTKPIIAGGETLHSEIHKLIFVLCGIRRNFHSSEGMYYCTNL
jgi:hypothetical protein